MFSEWVTQQDLPDNLRANILCEFARIMSDQRSYQLRLYFKKGTSEQHTAMNILLTLSFIRPVLCDYYTLRQGLNKIV